MCAEYNANYSSNSWIVPTLSSEKNYARFSVCRRIYTPSKPKNSRQYKTENWARPSSAVHQAFCTNLQIHEEMKVGIERKECCETTRPPLTCLGKFPYNLYCVFCTGYYGLVFNKKLLYFIILYIQIQTMNHQMTRRNKMSIQFFLVIVIFSLR